jgi:hypothetical protein
LTLHFPPVTLSLAADDTKKSGNSSGLQVQTVVARVNFPYDETRGLYRTLREQS